MTTKTQDIRVLAIRFDCANCYGDGCADCNHTGVETEEQARVYEQAAKKNEVTFHRATGDSGETGYMSARIVTPSGKEFNVSYHPCIKPGRDGGWHDGIGIGFDGMRAADGVLTEAVDTQSIWLEDKDSQDLFCSELFETLTGRYPHEVEWNIAPNEDYAPFPEEAVLGGQASRSCETR